MARKQPLTEAEFKELMARISDIAHDASSAADRMSYGTTPPEWLTRSSHDTWSVLSASRMIADLAAKMLLIAEIQEQRIEIKKRLKDESQ